MKFPLPCPWPARKYRLYFLLICGTVLYFFANLQRVAIPGTVFNTLQEQLHTTAPYITALGASFMYVYAAGQLVVGLFADRFGGIRTICGGGILFCLGTFLFPLTDSLPVMYCCRAMAGLGASSIYLSMVKEILRVFPGNYSIMLSFFALLGYSGGIAAGAPFAGLVSGYGLSAVLFGCAGITVCFYFGFILTGSTLKLPSCRNISLSLGNYKKVLRVRHNRNVFLFSGTAFGLSYVLQTVIGKKFLEDYCRMTSIHAAWVISAMTAIAAVAGLLWAILSKLQRNKRRPVFRILGWITLLSFGGILLMLILDCHSPLLMIFMLLLALASNYSSVLVPLLNETNSSELTGEAVAFSNFCSYLSVAIFGNLTGFLLNVFPSEIRNNATIFTRKSYFLLFAVLTLFALLVWFCAMRVRETNGKKTEVI